MIRLDQFPHVGPPQVDATEVSHEELLAHRTSLTSQILGDPFRPLLWYQRAVLYRRLGYPDLCVGDAYRALGFLDELEEEIEDEGVDESGEDEEDDEDDNGQSPIESSSSPKEAASSKAHVDSGDNQISSAENILLARAYTLTVLILALYELTCLRDAAIYLGQLDHVVTDIRDLSPDLLASSTLSSKTRDPTSPRDHPDFSSHAALLRCMITSHPAVRPKRSLDLQQAASSPPPPFSLSTLPDLGLAPRQNYPWSTHEPDRYAPSTLAILNGLLFRVAPDLVVRAVELPTLSSPPSKPSNAALPSPQSRTSSSTPDFKNVEYTTRTNTQLGLFALCSLPAGSTILREPSLLTSILPLDSPLCSHCGEPLPDEPTRCNLCPSPSSTPSSPHSSSSSSSSTSSSNVSPALFCSPSCLDLALSSYHALQHALPPSTLAALELLGRTTPSTGPARPSEALYFLLLARTVLVAEQKGIEPLGLDEVKYLWGDFQDEAGAEANEKPGTSNHGRAKHAKQPAGAKSQDGLDQQREQEEYWTPLFGPAQSRPKSLPFNLTYSIVLPQRFLELLGQVYPPNGWQTSAQTTPIPVPSPTPANPNNTRHLWLRHTLQRHDTWQLQLLFSKFRAVASARQSHWDGGPEVAAVHPLWCLANHDCAPNVRWDWGGAGGERRFVVEREIGEGEEVVSHYCDVDLGVKERRAYMLGSLGGECRCKRCVKEAGEEGE